MLTNRFLRRFPYARWAQFQLKMKWFVVFTAIFYGMRMHNSTRWHKRDSNNKRTERVFCLKCWTFPLRVRSNDDSCCQTHTPTLPVLRYSKRRLNVNSEPVDISKAIEALMGDSHNTVWLELSKFIYWFQSLFYKIAYFYHSFCVSTRDLGWISDRHILTLQTLHVADNANDECVVCEA